MPLFLFERTARLMFFDKDKPNAEIVDQCEDAVREYFGSSKLPMPQDVWERLRNYDHVPNSFDVLDIYAYLVICVYIDYAVEEFGADRKDFSYYINGNLDTHISYRNEEVYDPSALYQELQEKYEQLPEDNLERTGY